MDSKNTHFGSIVVAVAVKVAAARQRSKEEKTKKGETTHGSNFNETTS